MRVRPAHRQERRRSASRALLVALALTALAAVLGPLLGTRSAYAISRQRGANASTPPLIPVGLATAKSAAPQHYSITGLIPGSSADYLVNLANDGTASVPGVDIDVSTSSSTALDTDPTQGLVVRVDLCSVIWQQSAGGTSASCAGTTTTLLAAATLASLTASTDTELISGLAALSTGGVDHLRVRFSLPAGAPAGYSALASAPTVSIWGTNTVPGAPTGVSLTAGDGQLLASWTAPARTGGAAITAYTATASPGGATCTSAGTTCTVTGLTDGIAYTVTVTATNSVGTGAPSAGATGTPYPALLTSAASVLWLDGDDPSTEFQDGAATTPVSAAGQSVTVWKDKSGQHNDVTAPGSAPLADTTTYSGRRSVTFSSGRYLSRASGFPTNSDYTVLASYHPTNTSCTGNIVSGSSQRAFYIRGSFGLTIFHGGSQVSATEGATANVAYVGAGTFATSNRSTSIYVDSAPAVTGTVSNQTTDAGIQIGAFVGGYGFCGQVGEALVFSRVLTATERRTVESYLRRKWSVTLVPTAPTGASASAGNAQLAASWTASSDDGGAAITYTATATPGGATCTSSGTSCTITGLTNGTTYTVTVTATNTAGTSAASAASNSVTPVTTPGAPTSFTAARGNTEISTRWSAPASTGGSAITAYTVTAVPGGATCSTSGTSCMVTGLVNGTTYTLSVVATNAVGSGPASNSATGTPAAVPGPPTALTATPGDTTGSISWTAPASDGGSAITGYTATATPNDNTLATATCSTAGGGTSCSFSGLTNGAPYTVTVTAANANGSGYSLTGVDLVPYPTSILTAANVAAWFDASSSSRVLTAGGAVATSGQSVATWNDRSGNGLNATQATAANQMTVSTLNGRQALLSTPSTYFNGSGNGTFQTIFSVASPGNSTFNTTFAAPGNTDFSQRLVNGYIPTNTTPLTNNNNDWSNNGSSWTNSVAASGVAPSTGIFVSQAASAQVNKSFSVSTSFLTRGMNGPLGEVIAFKGTLTSADRRGVEEYLARKWSVSITPQAPTITSVTTPASGQLTVTWTAPAWNGGSAVTGYTVTATAGKTCSAAAGATSCTVTGLTPAQVYAVTMTATNAVGVGQTSASMNGTA